MMMIMMYNLSKRQVIMHNLLAHHAISSSMKVTGYWHARTTVN